LDEGSESRFRSIFKQLFRKNGQDLEEHILEAKDEGEIEREEFDMLLNVLDLGEKQVTEVMVPRIDMECAEISSSIREVAETIIGGDAHSRIPIFKDTKDRIIGMIHAKDLLAPLLEGKSDESIEELLRPSFFLPETATLDRALSAFKANGVHIAIVQDEYGGTSGLITLDDILEEIVGEIQDEYDAERPDEIEMLEDGSLLISGRVMLDDLDERFGIHLASEQVDSIGGYLAEMAGRIPHEGEFFTLEGLRFTVREADAKQISLIHVQPLKTQSTSE